MVVAIAAFVAIAIAFFAIAAILVAAAAIVVMVMPTSAGVADGDLEVLALRVEDGGFEVDPRFLGDGDEDPVDVLIGFDFVLFD